MTMDHESSDAIRGVPIRVRAMKALIFAASITLLAGNVSAANRLPYIASAAGLFADTISSYRFSTNNSGCLESNPRYQHDDYTFNARKATIETAVEVGVVWGFVWLTHRTQNKAVRWIGKGLAYFSGGIGGYKAMLNIRLCGF